MESVRRIRREKGLSQQELADKSGVGQDSISAIETGKHEPHPRTLRKLAKALDIEVADFFRELARPLARAPETGPADTEAPIFDAVHETARAQIRKNAQAFRRLKESGFPQQFSGLFEPEETFQSLAKRDPEQIAGAYYMLMYKYISLEQQLEQLQAQLREHERTHS